MKFKKIIYFILSAIFGFLVSYFFHAAGETWYLNYALQENLPLTWSFFFGLGYTVLPVYLPYILFLVGLIGGLILGHIWWHREYSEREKKK